jgi:transcriptional regulator with PAS, ATPase and Fis domain
MMNTISAEHPGGMTLSDHDAQFAIDPPGGFDPLEDLLVTISEALCVREVLPRVSQIANRVLRHDGLELVVRDQDGQVTMQARLPDGLPAHRVPETTRLGPDYRSSLSVRSRAGQQVISVDFFSKQAEAYTSADLPTARQIAAYIGIVVSHEQLAESRERVEAGERVAELETRTRSLAAAVERERGDGQAVGESVAWRKALTRAAQVASTEATVFLQGESGTGKEVLARFIHRASPRRRGPFVAINCAALPDQLLESELFGYERGAFTGAHQTKAGQIELASAGVLFLDEVSEMSAAAQAKLLRFLQEREFQRLGGTRPVKANVRVIAASNRDLRQAVAEGTFRADLYYRLQVFDICLPSLRERTTDIPLLAAAFLRNLGRSMRRPSLRLTSEATARLLAHPWPGNVRELHNALERAAILSDGGLIEPEHLSLHPAAVRAQTGTDLGQAERQTIQQVLAETDGNKAKAARRLGITRTQLYVRLRRHGLEGLPPLRVSASG